MKPPIIFLDFDGVLNNTVWATRPAKRALDKGDTYADRWARQLRQFDPENVGYLNRLLGRQPDARIVVSSAWRFGADVAGLERLLVAVGAQVAGRVVDKTPSGGVNPAGLYEAVPRGREIAAWLEAQDGAPRGRRPFVILDDDRDMDPLMPWLVQTDRAKGLVLWGVEAADAVLRRGVR